MIEMPQYGFCFRHLYKMINSGRQHASQHTKRKYSIGNNGPTIIGNNCFAQQYNCSNYRHKYPECMRQIICFLFAIGIKFFIFHYL